jgi:[acyl-carrier-protein] S-malonyltransferase
VPDDPATTALLFPGQGSQTSGMAAVTAAHLPALLNQARDELGLDPFERIAEGTHVAQPAIYCASLAHYEAADRPAAAMVSGHSLGELAALVVGGALGPEEGLRLAVVRGRLMEEASEQRPGGMLAVLGGEEETVRRVAASHELTVANDNAPGQLVLSGDAETIGDARKELRACGAKAIRLPIAGAFHSPLMAGAVDAFRGELDRVGFSAPSIPVISCTSAAPFGDDPRERLAAAFTEPVLWQDTLKRMRDDGATLFLETGPGEILTGLVRRTLPDLEARSLAEEVLSA